MNAVTSKKVLSACAAPRAVAARRVTRAALSIKQVKSAIRDLRSKFPVAKNAVMPAVFSQLLIALPAHAEEAGKLFDFDYTLPIMAAQFLLLMVVLDKTWFNPVGKVLDDRDEKLRTLLAGVQDNTADITAKEDEASKLVNEARAAAATIIADAKKEAETEGTEKLNALKKKLDAQYESAMAEIDAEEVQARKDLEPEIEKLAKQIVDKVMA